MKFKLGLAVTLCVALGTANVVAFAEENGSPLETAAQTTGEVIAAETPVVEAPVVEAPVVEAPVVEAPVVEAPVVEAPVVEAPVVEAPVVEAPVVEAPVVEAPVVEAPVVEAPVVEAPVVEVPAEEIIDIPEVEIPLAEVPLVEVPQEAATLKIIQRVHGLFESTDTEEVIADLTVGETVNILDYVQQDDNLGLTSEGGVFVLASGENEIVIDYIILSQTIEPSMIVEIDETSFEIVEEVSAE